MIGKKILILTTKDEPSTDDVFDWILYRTPNEKIIRISEEDHIVINNLKINNEEITFEIQILYANSDREVISLNELKSYWYRRGALNIFHSSLSVKNEIQKLFFKSVSEHLNDEYEFIINFIEEHFHSTIKVLNKASDNNTNKLENLKIAKARGLRVPSTIITSKGVELKKFFDLFPSVLLKPIRKSSNAFYFDKFLVKYAAPNKLLNREELSCFFEMEYFAPTLFQEYIEKKFEIRSFYLDDTIFSMAIFSQSNEKTKIDFRNYDYNMPNRNVPFQLPDDICDALKSVAKKLEMKSGSFDLIYTPGGEYVFLEINPIGQFQWVSKECNFFLEEKIAIYLSNQ